MTDHKALQIAKQKWGSSSMIGYNSHLCIFQVSSGRTDNLWGSGGSYEEAFREADRRAKDMGRKVTHTQSYEEKL